MSNQVFLAALGLISFATPVLSQAQTVSQQEIQQAIARGTEWLRTDMQKWRTEHQCGACHHAPLALYSLNAAGLTNDPFLKELTHWVTTDEARLIPQSLIADESSSMLSLPAVYLSLGLSAPVGQPDELMAIKRRLLQHLSATQLDDGSWAGPRGRIPVFAPPMEVTLFILGAWDAQREQFPEYVAMLDKASVWVKSQPVSDSHQELALRIMWLAKQVKTDQIAPLMECLQSLQNRSMAVGNRLPRNRVMPSRPDNR